MPREKLTEGDPQPDRNGGLDTAEHDLVIYRDMVLVNQPQQRRRDFILLSTRVLHHHLVPLSAHSLTSYSMLANACLGVLCTESRLGVEGVA
jgi:hypothetical protein